MSFFTPITIVVSTLNEGILGLQKTVQIQKEYLNYLIIFQNHKNVQIPDFLKREDIEIVETQTTGLSKSRNIGLKNCKTKYALIADDDIEYIESGLEKIQQILNTEELDFVTFKIRTLEGEPEYKKYPSEEYHLENPKHWFSSVEILLNVNSLKEKNITFDERFGLGTRLKKGEEEILIHDCIKAGLEGKFHPTYIAKHPYASSGKQKETLKQKMLFKGALLKRIDKKISYNNWKSYILKPSLLKEDYYKYLGTKIIKV